MSVGNFDAIHNSATTLSGSINQLFVDIEHAIAEGGSPAFMQVTLSEGLNLGTILDGLSKAAVALSNLSPGEIYPPPPILLGIRQAIEGCNHTITELRNFFGQTVRDNGGGSRLDSDSRTVITNNGNSLSFGGNLDALYPQYDALIRQLPNLWALTSSKRRTGHATPNIAAAASAAVSASKDANKASESARQATNDALDYLESTRKLLDEIQGNWTKLQTTVSNTDSLRLSAEKNRDDAERYLSEIGDILKKATESGASNNALSDAAQQLHKNLVNQQGKAIELILSLENQSDKVVTMTARADAMLSGATVAGLATSFGDAQKLLGKELSEARTSVKNAIWVTIALSSPLWLPTLLSSISVIWAGIVSFFAGFGCEWALKARAAIISQTDQPSFPTNGYALAAYLAARSALVVPGIVLLWFAIRRHNALFMLREHYAYKYSMAMSVTGFKLEAPEYQQEIAAMTLAEVAFNPGESLTPPRRRPFGPRRFFSKLAGKIEDAAAEKAKELAKKVTPTDPS